MTVVDRPVATAFSGAPVSWCPDCVLDRSDAVSEGRRFPEFNEVGMGASTSTCDDEVDTLANHVALAAARSRDRVARLHLVEVAGGGHPDSVSTL